ncbi:hypothetical protein C8J57DRAFT_1232318 [Mycena rebaudengoi]|nr:hypothetical protein C8J57DRAFT_1232318 [Mycena rebaudengoi]
MIGSKSIATMVVSVLAVSGRPVNKSSSAVGSSAPSCSTGYVYAPYGLPGGPPDSCQFMSSIDLASFSADADRDTSVRLLGPCGTEFPLLAPQIATRSYVTGVRRTVGE